ncbi:MAG: CAP domain-containing protein [Anaerolineae bacterium]|nr:CAP domain-containing protein [Thermoflexales bacterium]MDW8408499.1 CAP domain-containing protein [Anaerolineae bacterium]
MLTRWVLVVPLVVWASWMVVPSIRAFQSLDDLDPVIGEAVTATADAPAVRQPHFTGCTVVTFSSTHPDFEQQVVERVNDHRASIGLPPLKRVSLLDEAARYHARDMRDDDYFGHDTFDRLNGQLTAVCGFSQRVGSHYTNWMALGENIAGGYANPTAVMNAWLNSSGHRANIESTDRWEIGVGYVAGGYYGHYWTQDFGRRANVYPLVIQREYSRTATPQVTIYIYGAWQQMRLRNDSDAWMAWQTFSNTLTWQLNWTQGTRQVCAELKSGSQTVTSCDTIDLTTSAPVLSAQPSQVSFVRVLSAGQSFPQTVSLNLTNSGSDQTLNWQLVGAPSWLNVTPSSGSTPNPNVQLSLNTPQIPTAPGLYTAVIQFNAINASTSATVHVVLRVVNSLPYRSFLPAGRR